MTMSQMLTRRWAALLIAALPTCAGASVVQTIDRYLLLEGPFAGETLVLETRYAAPSPDAVYLSERGVAEVAFLGLGGTDDDALVINTEPRDFDGAEIYADFAFDPASNAAGLGGIFMDPSGGVVEFLSGPPDDFLIDQGFGSSGRDWSAEFERSAALIPLPPSGALFLGGVGAGLLLRLRGGRDRMGTARAR
jgi:hypothetical protein